MAEFRELFELPLIEEHAGSDDLASRDPLLDEIETALDDQDCRIVLVRGDPGSGKTTLMAGLASRHPDWPRYFVQRAGQGSGVRNHDGSLASFLTTVGLQLAASRPKLFPDSSREFCLDVDVVERYVAPEARTEALRIERLLLHPFRTFAARVRLSVDVLEGQAIGLAIREIGDAALVNPAALEFPALIEPLEIMRRDDPRDRIVVIVDGLDELRVRDAPVNVGKWLAEHPQLHPNLRFVVSSRDDYERLDDLREMHGASLREVDASKDAEIAVQEYAATVSTKPHVARILQGYGRRPEWFAHRAALKAAGIFQYVAFLDRALATVDREGTGASTLYWLGSDDEAEWPNGIGGLYASFMLRIKNQVQELTATRNAWDQVYRPLLGLLLVAHAPLTAAQLAAFAGIDAADAAAAGESCEAALLRLDQFLGGGPATGYQFFHSSVADYVGSPAARASLRCDEDSSHLQITEHALSRHQEDGGWKAADPYLRMFLAAHAAAVRRLDDLLEDPRFLAAANPAELLATLGNAKRTEAIATVYRRAAAGFREPDEPAALAHLELYAREAGERAFARRVAEMPGPRPWTTAWTHRGRLPVRGVIGRHEAGITAIAVTRDDYGHPLVLTGGKDGQIGVWDPRKGKLLRPPLAPAAGESASPVTALAVGQLRNGQAFVVSGGWDGMVRAWNVPARRPLCAPLAGAENAGGAVAVGSLDDGSPPGGLAAVCEAFGSMRVWDVANGTPLGPPIPVSNLALAAVGLAGGRVLVAAASASGATCEVRVWDAASGQPAGPPLETEEDPFEALAVGEADGVPVVAVTDTALGVQLFDARTGKARTRRQVCWDDSFEALAIGALGGKAVLAAGGKSGLIRLWDLLTWQPAGEPVTAHPDGRVTALSIRSGVLLSAGVDRVTADIALGLGEAIRHTAAEPVVQQWAYSEKSGLHRPVIVARPNREVKSVAVGMGDSPVVACCDGYRVVLLDGATGEAGGKPMFGPCERVRAVAATSLDDGTPTAIAGVEETIRVWDVERGTQLYPPLAAPRGSTCAGLAVTRLAGRQVVVVSTWRSGARVWDLATGEPAGAGELAAPEYVSAMTAGGIGGRPAAVFGTARGITIHDLEAGDPVLQFALGDFAEPSVASLFEDGGQIALVLAATNRGTVTICDLGASSNSAVVAQRTITVPDELAALALTRVDGRPVAVCGGQEGNIQIVDLFSDGGTAAPARSVLSTAVATTTSAPVVVCACEDEVQVLSLATGEPVPSPSTAFGLDRMWSKVATAEIAGRAVGVCSAGREIHTWYLDTGEPAAPEPLRFDQRVESLATGLLNGRSVIISGHFDQTIRILDLETGEPACETISCTLSPPSGLGLAAYSGWPILVFNQYGVVRSLFVGLDQSPLSIEELLALPHDFPAQEETPPAPPRVGNKVKLSRYRNVNGHAMALGTMAGAPVVLSGHDDGQIDIFTIGTALPIGPPLMAHDSEVTALAFAELDERPIAASGGRDGTVHLWDLAAASTITTIRAAAEVRSLALHPPGYCVIGTQRGLLAVQFPLPPATASASSRIPVDVRAARACPEHQDHVTETVTGGVKVMRMCIKGIQIGNPATKPLEYAQGHCYVFPDRLVLTRQYESEGDPAKLTIPLHPLYVESTDVPHAYEYDGGHFRITIETPHSHRSLCCYRRSERDLLARLIDVRRN